MKLYRILLLLVAASFASTVVYADRGRGRQDGSDFAMELNERDWDALREFLNSKRTVDIRKKADNLTISGDVRTEWRHLMEQENGRQLRGRDGYDHEICRPISRNDFDIEMNLRFDYTVERTWAVVHLQYDNAAGIDGQTDTGCECDPFALRGSGSCDGLCLKKAYFGYNLVSDCDTRFDIEIGRRGNLYNVFDSNVEYTSRLDGILLHFASSWECVADYYWKFAGFVVDEKVNHFAWATELGFLNIADTGFDFKYSFINWVKNGRTRCWPRIKCQNNIIKALAKHVRGPVPADSSSSEFSSSDTAEDRFLKRHLIDPRNVEGNAFRVSQFLLLYNLNPDLLCGFPSRIYGAFLVNHAARNLRIPICAPISNLRGEVPNFDGVLPTCGCGNLSRIITHFKELGSKQPYAWYIGFRVGEVLQEGDWAFDIQYQWVEANAVPDTDVGGIGRGNVLDSSFTEDGRGNTNFKGWKAEGLYAFTDDITINMIIEASRAIDKDIGGQHAYSKVEVEAIYAF